MTETEKNTLITRLMPVAHAVIDRRFPSIPDRDEAESLANLALWRAVETWDEAESALKTWVEKCVHNALLSYVTNPPGYSVEAESLDVPASATSSQDAAEWSHRRQEQSVSEEMWAAIRRLGEGYVELASMLIGGRTSGQEIMSRLMVSRHRLDNVMMARLRKAMAPYRTGQRKGRRRGRLSEVA